MINIKKLIGFIIAISFLGLFVKPSLAADLVVGNDASERPVTDTRANFAIIDTNHPTNLMGSLSTFKYYASNKNPFRFLLVDETLNVKWVSDQITPASIGVNILTLKKPVQVKSGWNVGMYFVSTGTIPFEYVGKPATYTSAGLGVPTVDSTLTSDGTSGRTYSFVATGKMICSTIKDLTILDSVGSSISLGYDQWGYNYQANMFNGWYDNYGRPTTPVTEGDWLMMKWNNAWLSNQDCDGDGKLDRHLGYPTYIDSGAWLTNHAKGTYESASLYNWDTTNKYNLAFVLGGTYNHDLFLTDTNGVLSGNGGYIAGGPYSYTWDIISGSVVEDIISFDAVYTGGPDAVGTIMHVTGAIASGGTMSGEWNDNYLGVYREGEWSTTTGTAEKVMDMCSWSDFVKIVAVPSSAHSEVDKWYTDSTKTTEIGPSIWGSFAIIQEVSSDPCGEGVDLENYKSQLRSGLGNW